MRKPNSRLSVLSGKPQTLYWLKEAGAITEEDEQNFIKITEMRNMLVHNMSETLYEGLPDNIAELYITMLRLFEKITKWWIRAIEIPVNPDITSQQYENISWDNITSVNLEFLKIITEISLNSTEKYQQMYKEFDDNFKKI